MVVKGIDMHEMLNLKILVIEPHFDDAIYSMGGTICKLSNTNTDVTVLTVFNVYQKANTDRYLEQLSAFRGYICHLKQLNYKDAVSRSNDLILEKNMFKEIKHKIQQLILDKSIDIMFFPMACGNHVDHIIVHQICKSLDVKHKYQYEDLPYAYKYSAKSKEGYVICKIDIEEKIKRCLLYKTQINIETIKKIREHAYLIGKAIKNCDYAEKFWIS